MIVTKENCVSETAYRLRPSIDCDVLNSVIVEENDEDIQSTISDSIVLEAEKTSFENVGFENDCSVDNNRQPYKDKHVGEKVSDNNNKETFEEALLLAGIVTRSLHNNVEKFENFVAHPHMNLEQFIT